MLMNDPLGDMLTRIRNAQLPQARYPARRRPPRCAPACSTSTSHGGYIRGYSRMDSTARPSPDRAEIFRRPAGDPRDPAGLEAGPSRLFLGEEHSARGGRPRRVDPVDAEGRHVGPRGAQPECRRRGALPRLLTTAEIEKRVETMSRIGKKPVPVPKGVTANDRGPDGQRQGTEGRARRDAWRPCLRVAMTDARRRGRAARRDEAGARALGHVAHDGAEHLRRRDQGLRAQARDQRRRLSRRGCRARTCS